MSALLKLEEYLTTGQQWICYNKADVAGVGNQWWVIADLLGMRKDDYVKWLIENYHPTYINYNNTLIYTWDKLHYADMHKFVLYVNKKAKEKRFVI